jgi:hypothetical protein
MLWEKPGQLFDWIKRAEPSGPVDQQAKRLVEDSISIISCTSPGHWVENMKRDLSVRWYLEHQ